MTRSSDRVPRCGHTVISPRTFYEPETVYFSPRESPDFDRIRAAQFTARFVARRATSYVAYPVGLLSATRKGELPHDPRAREAVIVDLFAWLQQPYDRDGAPWVPNSGLLLYRKNAPILDQHDGVPATIALTPHEFTKFQEQLERSGLPRNLYFPREAIRTEIEPVELFGGVVMGPKRYTPLQWARRKAGGRTPLRLPSDMERRDALLHAWSKFSASLARRRAELREPGSERDGAQLEALETLLQAMEPLFDVLVRPGVPEDHQSNVERTRE